eukprot:SAG31_NODE_5031_length_2792_cov_2.309320_4_plen_407_part_00
MLRQKSYLSVCEREHWLHVGAPAQYVAQMRLKRALLGQASSNAARVMAGDSQTQGAEHELFEEVVAWLELYYRDRFEVTRALDGKIQLVLTTTPGYVHLHRVADYEREPGGYSRLLGLLIQEDVFLLREEPAPMLEKTAWPQADSYDSSDHLEEHPSGLAHRLVAGCSVFSFDIQTKRGQPMSSIHHPHVPGWYRHLQRSMNRLFAGLRSDDKMVWYRHNINPMQADQMTECLTHGHPWAASIHKVLDLEPPATHEEPVPPGTTHVEFRRKSLERRLVAGGSDFIHSKLMNLTEFQTLRRLPRSDHIAFCVRTYVDRYAALRNYPAAAQAMAAAIRRKYRASLERSGIGQEAALRPILNYLDEITSKAGLATDRLVELVLEPWLRHASADGTRWPRAANGHSQARL